MLKTVSEWNWVIAVCLKKMEIHYLYLKNLSFNKLANGAGLLCGTNKLVTIIFLYLTFSMGKLSVRVIME